MNHLQSKKYLFLQRLRFIFFTFLNFFLLILPISYIAGHHYYEPIILIWIPCCYLIFKILSLKSTRFFCFKNDIILMLFLICLSNLLLFKPSIFYYNCKYYLLGILILCSTIDVVIENSNFTPLFMYLMSFLGLILGIKSLYQSISLHNYARVSAYFSHPNYLGFFLAISFSCELYLILHRDSELFKHKILKHIFIFFSIIFTILGIILSGCRSSWIAIFIILLILSKDLYELYKKYYLSMVVILILLFFEYKHLITRRLITMFKFTNPRILLWKKSIIIISKHMLLGYGIGINNWQLHPPWATKTFPHNFFLEIAMASGIIGLTAFCLFLFFLIKNYLLPLIKKRNGKLYICLILAPFISAVIDIPFFSPHFFIMFWLCLGIVIGNYISIVNYHEK